MTNLSLLIFSRNDVEDAIALARDMYGNVNDIVIIDSSDRKEHARLKQMKMKLHLSKLRIYYVVALGYPEPLRQYGFNKCKNDWILLMDTDERISPALKLQLPALISDKKVCGYYLKRYEEVHDGTIKNKFHTWQLRLYRKSRIISNGGIHETPLVNGMGTRLEDHDAYMEHREELKHYGKQGNSSYVKMYVFDPKPLYWLIARDIYIAVGFNGLKALLSIDKIIGNSIKTYRGGRTPEIKEITRIISKIGLIKFLGLDKEETIRMLNKKYGNREQGMDLLIKLLKERYNKNIVVQKYNFK
jgi:glycosyltransferase involved in cell wall biosynthesis